MSKTVGDFLIERLHTWGVRRIFGYPGDGVNGVLAALQRAKGRIDFVQVRHEEMAAFMACAYAKFTGELGVCLSTGGPGAGSKPAVTEPLQRIERAALGAGFVASRGYSVQCAWHVAALERAAGAAALSTTGEERSGSDVIGPRAFRLSTAGPTSPIKPHREGVAWHCIR